MKQLKPPVLIAEIGNNHEGDLLMAIHLISLAKWAGADLIKFQAGHAEDFARNKKQIKFYKKYDLGLEAYEKLLKIGMEINVPVFFSVWSKDYTDLIRFEQYHKLAARQFNYDNIQIMDSDNTFISIPYKTKDLIKYKSVMNHSTPLHCVPEYPSKNPHLEEIPKLRKLFNRPVGYSDHTIGINACVDAVVKYGAIAIEKHFTLAHDFGQLRDHKLSATANEFRQLKERVKNENTNNRDG